MKPILFVIAMLASAAAAGSDVKSGAIQISNIWSRETPPTAQVGGGFMTLTNTGKSDDALLAVRSEISKSVELHTHSMDGGVMKMREVPRIDVPAGGKAELKPGGFHIMFIDLKTPLVAGQKISATLVFEKAGDVKVEMPIQPFGYKPAVAAESHKH
jgi:periplasmic copper chaperone A